MSKNSFLSSKQFSKGNIALFCLLLMFVGFLGARVFSSIGMFLFGVNAIRDVAVKRWREARSWLFCLCWMTLFAASWFWSANKDEWGAHFQVKLPFLLLPLAFHFLPPFTARQMRIFTWMLVSLMAMGAAYSVSFFVRHPAEILQGYAISHILPTPAYDDHIAFSMAIAMTVAWCFYYWPRLSGIAERVLMAALVLFFVGYLHLLAAKSGLIALYLLFICQIVYLFACGKWKSGLLIVATIFGLYKAAYTFIPTFHNRVEYVHMNLRLINSGEQGGMYGDVSRIHSYDIAEKLIAAHPAFGVGAGDVFDEMNVGYDKWHPQVLPEQRLWPHNQFLTFALAAGIPCSLLFIGWILAPMRLLRKNKESFYFIASWLMLLIPLMIDPFLEVQWGVFVYLFFLLWFAFLLKGGNGLKPIDLEQKPSN